jgi:hypothetical protein
MQVEQLLFSGMNLTSNSTEDGVAAKVADSMGLSEDIVLKAYSKIEKGDPRLEKGEGYNDPLHYVTTTFYDDDGNVEYRLIGDIL